MDNRISINDSDLLQLVACACSNNTLSMYDDKKLIKKLRRIFENRCMEDDFEDLVEYPLGIKKTEEQLEEEKELKKRKKEIENIDGIFRCPKCNISTNEKTYRTTCVICNTPLLRQ